MFILAYSDYFTKLKNPEWVIVYRKDQKGYVIQTEREALERFSEQKTKCPHVNYKLFELKEFHS